MTPDPLARGTSPPAGGLAETDLAGWLTVAGAAAAIGCSKRTIERLAASRQLEQRLRPQAGSPAVAVYNPDDVARIASERRPGPAPFVLPAGVTSPVTGNGNGKHTADVSNRHTGLVRTSGDDPISQLCAFVLQTLQSPPSPPVAEQVAETVTPEERANQYLTLTEAAAVKRVSERLVLRWIRTGSLPVDREPRSQWTAEDRGWRIRRKDLEAL